MYKRVEFYRAKELKEAVKDISDDKKIMCQVVGKDGTAWNMWGSISIPDDGAMVCITFEHDALKSVNPISIWEHDDKKEEDKE